MKVIEDKVAVYPPHAISKADIPIILSSLPPTWTDGIETIKLSAFQRPRWIACYFDYNHTLTICSRGFTKWRTIQAILMELGAHGLGLQYQRQHRLQQRDVERLLRVIAPFVEQIVPQLSQKKVWLDH